MLSSNDPRGRCVCVGCLCCYISLDCSEITCCVAERCEVLFLRQSFCLAAGAKHLGFCCCCPENDPRYAKLARDDCCKLGLLCFSLGLICPTVLCANACKVLCLQTASSFPCHENYLGTGESGSCVCAFCFVECLPECGCCVAPPKCLALEEMKAPPVKQLIVR